MTGISGCGVVTTFFNYDSTGRLLEETTLMLGLYFFKIVLSF
jgi:hypothetical protein